MNSAPRHEKTRHFLRSKQNRALEFAVDQDFQSGFTHREGKRINV